MKCVFQQCYKSMRLLIAKDLPTRCCSPNPVLGLLFKFKDIENIVKIFSNYLSLLFAVRKESCMLAPVVITLVLIYFAG